MGYSLPAVASGSAALALSGARGLALSASGTSSTVGIAATEAVCTAAGQAPIHLGSVTLTLDLATMGADGLDSGALAGSTWYAVFIIAGPGGTAALASLSPTAPTLPAGYTVFTRVGWIRTDATVNKYPLAFAQQGSRVQYAVGATGNLLAEPTMVIGPVGSWGAGKTPTWDALSVSPFVPPTASTIHLLLHNNFKNVAATGPYAGVYVAPNPNHQGVLDPNGNTSFLWIDPVSAPETRESSILLESSDLYVVASASGGAVQCTGWEDAL